MLVNFHTPAERGDVIMLEKDAVELLRLTGHSGTVPGAFDEDEVAAAADRLRREIERYEAAAPGDADSESGDEDDEAEEADVGLRVRAWPLLAMLDAAAHEGVHVIWEARR